jgi:hypothetical protein
MFHEKVKRIASRPTTETMEESPLFIYVEGGFRVLMKWTDSVISPPHAFEGHIFAYDFNYIDLLKYLLDYPFGYIASQRDLPLGSLFPQD